MLTTYVVFHSYRDRDRGRAKQSRYRLGRRITRKREATRVANRLAQRKNMGVYPRQVSVYDVPPGKKRGTLVHQVHYNSKLQRLIKEEL